MFRKTHKHDFKIIGAQSRPIPYTEDTVDERGTWRRVSMPSQYDTHGTTLLMRCECGEVKNNLLTGQWSLGQVLGLESQGTGTPTQ